MPQLSGTVNGVYHHASEVTPRFLQGLRNKGVHIEKARVPADSLKPTQTTGDMRMIRGLADALKSGKKTDTKPIVVSSDGHVLDGHHTWAGRILADKEGGHNLEPGMPVYKVGLPMDQLLDEARTFGAKHGITSRGHGEFQGPHGQAMTSSAITAARGHHTKGGPFHWRHGWIPIGGEGGGGVGVSKAQHEASQAAQVHHHVARELARPETIAKLRSRGLSPEDVRSQVTQRTLSRMRGETPRRVGPERKGPVDVQQFTSHPAVAPAPGTVPYKGRYGDVGKGKQPYGGLFDTGPKPTGGQHDVTSAASGVLGKARIAEPRTTKNVQGAVERRGGRMEGLEFRLKTPESLERKIKGDMAETGLDAHTAASKLFDVNRYTGVFPEKNYAQSTQKVIDDLRAQGYKLRVKNFWNKEDNPYQGVNIQVTAPDGHQFELQFHTDKSLAVKVGPLHQLYEKQRVLPPESKTERAALGKQMFDVANGIPIPAHAALIS